MEEAYYKLTGEQPRKEMLVTELKQKLVMLEGRLASHGKKESAYKERVTELEGHIMDLAKQLEKWTVLSIGKKVLQPVSPRSAMEYKRHSTVAKTRTVTTQDQYGSMVNRPSSPIRAGIYHSPLDSGRTHNI